MLGSANPKQSPKHKRRLERRSSDGSIGRKVLRQLDKIRERLACKYRARFNPRDPFIGHNFATAPHLRCLHFKFRFACPNIETTMFLDSRPTGFKPGSITRGPLVGTVEHTIEMDDAVLVEILRRRTETGW